MDHLRFSLAESCTGGAVAQFVTSHAGASNVFAGGVVSYINPVKTSVLGVPEELIQSHTPVSLEVAKAMALGVQKLMSTPWSLSVTGWAGPGGGTPEQPVGTVCFALLGPDFEKLEQCMFTGSNGVTASRENIQSQAVDYAIQLLKSQNLLKGVCQ